jgi:ABC-2 type transport system permease protein
MLTSAIAAESYKFLRHRTVLFWAYLFVPASWLLFFVAMDAYVDSMGNALRLAARLDTELLRALQAPGSSLLQIFYIMGAGVIFASEYGTETWRLLTTRLRRRDIVLAKFVTFGAAAAVSLLLLCLAALMIVAARALRTGEAPLLPDDWALFGFQFLGLFAASWLQLFLLCGLAALVAVLTRSLLAATLAVILIGLAQSIAIAIIPDARTSVAGMAAFPAISADMLRAWFANRPVGIDVYSLAQSAATAAALLIGWCVFLVTATSILFQRQELSRE